MLLPLQLLAGPFCVASPLSNAQLQEENALRFAGFRRFLLSRRLLVLTLTSSPSLALAEETTKIESSSSSSSSLIDGVLSIFDADEVTKSGKKLPKSYVRAAKEVVKKLRDSIGMDVREDEQRFREAANGARDAIRDYLSGWRGSKLVEKEESYRQLEKALRELGRFYSKSGPNASLPDDVRSAILLNLSNAEADL